MKWSEWLENWSMTSLKIKAPFLDMTWAPTDPDKNAAWELYVELLTRIATQPLNISHGDEKTALRSVFSLFELTRNTIKFHGRGCKEFTKIAIVILNQIVRPFSAKWHKIEINGGFDEELQCAEFREELEGLQSLLITYTKMLGDMAGVEEDLSSLEDI